jgi:hypothetical protein
MKRLLFMFCFWTFGTLVSAQSGDSKINVDKQFELEVDSIERIVTINKWGTDTSFFIHYTVTNIILL